MKVLLVNPPIAPRERGNAVVARLFYNSMPLGLGYLAAIAERDGHEAMIIDAAVERLTMAELMRRTGEFGPDLIGLTGVTTSWVMSVATANAFRQRWPSIPLIVGGPHLAAWREDALSDTPFDAGVLGEGETAFARILAGEPWPQIPGLLVREDGRLRNTGPAEVVSHLDELPYPARHLMKKELYRPIPADYRELPKIPMITTRGCPHGCIFCDKNVFGRRMRAHSVERVLDEVEHCIAEHGARGIAFLDSTFATLDERAKDIARGMIARGIKTEWTCTLRADTVDEEMFALFREAGCWRARLGIESGDPEILRRIDKDVKTEQIRQAAEWGDKQGIQMKAFFMLGHFGETDASVRRSIEFALSLPLMEVTVQINTPMRGTPQYEQWSSWGSLTGHDTTDFSFWEPVFVPHGWTRESLMAAQRRFYRRFLLRPKLWWRHLRNIHGWRDVRRYLEAIRLVLYLILGRDQRSA
ncbi:MAG: radical SAM protein [Candidatus Lernaella stagnicola]|nr:radical SAM protein [Candidatus Lernaella stagnicola]